MKHYKAQGINFNSIGYHVHAIGVKLEIDTDSNEVHGFKVDNESLDLHYDRIVISADGKDILFSSLEEEIQIDILNGLIIEMQNQ